MASYSRHKDSEVFLKKRKRIRGKLWSTIDLKQKGVTWTDIIDENRNFHFSLWTLNEFAKALREEFDFGFSKILFLGTNDVILNKKVIRPLDVTNACRLYRKHLKENEKSNIRNKRRVI